MSELLGRMARAPAATAYLLLASLLVNALGLISSLYVIQVLNRYVSYGVTATLASLTVGVVLAVAGECVFRRLRLGLAEDIVGDTDERLSTGVFGLLLTCPLDRLEQRPPGERLELVRGIERAERAFGSGNLAAVADVPYSLLFLAALALLSVPLAMVAAVFCLASLLLAWLAQRRLAQPVRALARLGEGVNALTAQTITGADTIRQFGGEPLLMTRWRTVTAEARSLHRGLAFAQNGSAALGLALQSLMGVAMIAAGAVLVVDGQLDVGALIGANLIAARALAPLSRLAAMGEALKAAGQSLSAARQFAGSVPEAEGRKILPGWTGRLELSSLGLVYPGAGTPLFSRVALTLEPGGVLVITGRNGTGKSSLLRVIAGLLPPSRGQVLVEGVDLRQVSLEWWRRQVAYVPQEPVFLEGTLRETLTSAQPAASEDQLMTCLAQVGLKPMIDRHPAGLDQPLAAGGRNLAPGLRRRLALARALLVDGPLFLLDEPSEGLDREGSQAVYALLIELVRRGKTLVVVSHDPAILQGARLHLRFDGGEPELLRLAAGGG